MIQLHKMFSLAFELDPEANINTYYLAKFNPAELRSEAT